jgi:uncharacterized protein
VSRARAVRGPALALLLAAALAAPAARAVEVPYLSGRVVDDAGLLDGAARERIEALLTAYEQRTTAQLVVVTLRTLDGESIEAFAERAFLAWKLGQKGKDNGVLLVVVPDDRKMRIEVGYGLEGALTDAAASRIIRNVLAPAFREKDFAGGIERGLQAIIGQLDGEAGAIPDDPAPAEASGFKGPDLSWPERLAFGAFIFGILGLFTVMGVCLPGTGWFLYPFLIPFWAIFPMVVVGWSGALVILGIHLVCFPIAKLIVSRTAWYKRGGWGGGSGGGGSGRTGWISSSSSSSSSSSWSSGSSSGSSFSGGGGSSGGGGASGGW